MKRLILLSIVLVVIFALAACGGGGEDGGSDEGGLNLTQGEYVFNVNCVSCHSLDKDVVLVGPSLYGIAGRAAASGGSPEEYLRTTILDPAAELTEGFGNLMPNTYEASISPDDLDALILFLMNFD